MTNLYRAALSCKHCNSSTVHFYECENAQEALAEAVNDHRWNCKGGIISLSPDDITISHKDIKIVEPWQMQAELWYKHSTDREIEEYLTELERFAQGLPCSVVPPIIRFFVSFDLFNNHGRAIELYNYIIDYLAFTK